MSGAFYCEGGKEKVKTEGKEGKGEKTLRIFELGWKLQLALDGESPIPASFSKPHSLRDSPTKKRSQKAQFHTVGDYYNSSAVATSSPSLCLTFQVFTTQSQLVADTLSPLASRLHNLLALVQAAASPAVISGTAGLWQKLLCSNKPAAIIWLDLVYCISRWVYRKPISLNIPLENCVFI